MKTITCREMGGMCDAPISANTYDEMMMMGMAHLEQAHPEMAADVKAMPKDDPKMVQWEMDSKKMWADKPEM